MIAVTRAVEREFVAVEPGIAVEAVRRTTPAGIEQSLQSVGLDLI